MILKAFEIYSQYFTSVTSFKNIGTFETFISFKNVFLSDINFTTKIVKKKKQI